MPNPSKGVRNHQKLVRGQMVADRMRGLTFGQIAIKYKRDRSNVRKAIFKEVETQEELNAYSE